MREGNHGVENIFGGTLRNVPFDQDVGVQGAEKAFAEGLELLERHRPEGLEKLRRTVVVRSE